MRNLLSPETYEAFCHTLALEDLRSLKMSPSFQQASSILLKVSNISIKNCLFLSKKVLWKKINKTSRFFKRMNLLKRTQWLLTTDRRIKKIISKQPIFPQNVSICVIIRDHALSWPRLEFWGNTDWRRTLPLSCEQHWLGSAFGAA